MTFAVVKTARLLPSCTLPSRASPPQVCNHLQVRALSRLGTPLFVKSPNICGSSFADGHGCYCLLSCSPTSLLGCPPPIQRLAGPAPCLNNRYTNALSA